MGFVIISWGGMARSLLFSFLGVAAVGTVALSLPIQGVFRDPATLIPTDETALALAQNQHLIWPTTGNISQGFHRYHEGLDIAGPVGTPILAAQAGEVILAGWDDWGLGYAVEILHNDGSRTVYGHNQLLYVNQGEWVMQGQAIAEMGSTGNSTGPHLHFEWRHLMGGDWVPVDAGPHLEWALAEMGNVMTASLPETERLKFDMGKVALGSGMLMLPRGTETEITTLSPEDLDPAAVEVMPPSRQPLYRLDPLSGEPLPNSLDPALQADLGF